VGRNRSVLAGVTRQEHICCVFIQRCGSRGGIPEDLPWMGGMQNTGHRAAPQKILSLTQKDGVGKSKLEEEVLPFSGVTSPNICLIF
jgi:hypothetical protein